MLWVYRNCR